MRFETCFQILTFMGGGEFLLDLPWVSRYIAEESVNAYSMMGIFDTLTEEHRVERIAAAYMGGLVYLILQS